MPIANPFFRSFPDADWERVELTRGGFRLERLREINGRKQRILALPAGCGPRPEEAPAGYTRFLRVRGSGWWLRIMDLDPPTWG